MPRRRAPLVVLLLACAACGRGDAAPASSPPLAATLTAPRALQCTTEVAATGHGNYDSGPESLQADARAALDDFREEEAVLLGLPDVPFEASAHDGARVLFTYAPEGRVTAAALVRDDLAGPEGRRGWGVGSWAVCDLADQPAAVAEAAGVEVWTEADGTPVATSRVHSSPGPEHCGWESVTFLGLAEGRGRTTTYVRDPRGLLDQDPLVRDTTVPGDARETGWRREGRRLWLTPEAAYVGASPDRVERWPAAAAGCA